VLTKDEKMLLTPTYHVFEMYTVHHDATLLPSDLECAQVGPADDRVPALSASASKDSAGKVHITLSNLDPQQAHEVACELKGMKPSAVRGRVLTAQDINARNTFESPRALEPATFEGAKLDGGALRVNLPAKSVAVLELE
jgi:alpha-N-arabinofuranosidase